MNPLHIISISGMLVAGVCSFTLPEPSAPDAGTERFVEYHENGVQRVSANFRKNKLSGAWTSWFVSGIKCDSGRFTGNVPDGEWKSWYPSGKLRVVWHFNARKLAGVKDELQRQPKVRQYAIAQKPVAEAVGFYQVAYWYKEQTDAAGVTRASSLISPPPMTRGALLHYVDNNTAHATGTYRPPFTEALLHGNYTSYHPDGSLKEDGVFINGMREGTWEEFGADGLRWRGSYLHNLKEGEWRSYRGDKPVSFIRYNSRGEVMESHYF